jgi:hypothetical protein
MHVCMYVLLVKWIEKVFPLRRDTSGWWEYVAAELQGRKRVCQLVAWVVGGGEMSKYCFF